jgi:hypothetical protein
MSSPWADPSTPTEPGAPYSGPHGTTLPPSYGSPYGPPVYGPPAYGAVPYGSPYPPQPYGHPAPWYPPQPPRRPGQLITAAVLAFVQAAMVLIASLYVWFFASLADFVVQESQGGFSAATADALATEGTVVAIVQLVSFVLLVGAGIRALNARTRGAWLLLVVAHVVQVLLSVYWAVRLSVLLDGAGAEGAGPLLVFTAFFAAGPVVAIGLLMTGTVRGWFAPPSQAARPLAA